LGCGKDGDIFIKMMKGIEIGLEPVASMDLIDVIQGKPTLKPQGMLALTHGSGQLSDIMITDDGNCCTVKMKRGEMAVHIETFSQDDAKVMGLSGKDNWKKQPAVMRKWRAVSAACRIVFPDIIQGMYIPEELSPDTTVDDSGEIVDASPPALPEVSPPKAESNGRAKTLAWSKVDANTFMDTINTLFPGSLAIQAGIKAELKIEKWSELGTVDEAVNVWCTHLYDKCAPVLVKKIRYVADLTGNRKEKYFEFCVDEKAEIHPVIRAYGRSTTIKSEWLTDYEYTIALGWDNYDDPETWNQWGDIGVDIVMHYEQNDHGTLIATGIGHNIVDPQLAEDAKETF